MNLKTQTTMRNSTRIKKTQLLQVLGDCGGEVTSACKTIGIAKSTYYEWCRNDMEFRNKVLQVEKQVEKILRVPTYHNALKGIMSDVNRLSAIKRKQIENLSKK